MVRDPATPETPTFIPSQHGKMLGRISPAASRATPNPFCSREFFFRDRAAWFGYVRQGRPRFALRKAPFRRARLVFQFLSAASSVHGTYGSPPYAASSLKERSSFAIRPGCCGFIAAELADKREKTSLDMVKAKLNMDCCIKSAP
jgi:hypothetical protein